MAESHQGTEQHSGSEESERKNEETIDKPFKVYKRRWLMLIIVFVLNLSNGALWISFATITFQTTNYFEVSTNAVNWFSLIFFITTIPFMFIAMWVVDRFGFKAGVQSGCFLNAAGSIIRLLGMFDYVSSRHTQYVVVMTGQTVASLAQPFAMSLPTKVSEVWFPQTQRTLSTTIGALGNPLGFMVASLIAPIVVSDEDDVPIPNYIFSALGIFAGLLGLLVWRSKPATPPSSTADKPDRLSSDYSYARSLKEVLKNKSFVVLMFAVGGGMGLLSGLQTMMDQMLCSWGYSDDFAGICCAVMVVGGFVGAAVFSYIVERTKLYEELINILFAITVIIAIIFIMIFHIRDIEWVLAVVSTVLGFLAVGIYPMCLEVGVETTYPIDESISTGAIVVMGQILGAAFVLIMEALEVPLTAGQVRYQNCQSETTQPANMNNAGLFVVACATVLSVAMLIFFRPKYLRLEAERMAKVMTNAPSTATITSQETILPNEHM